MMEVKVTLPVERIALDRGLGRSKAAQRALAEMVRRRCDKYVPLDTGALKNTVRLDGQGRTIAYLMPYAQRQFYENYRHRDPNRGNLWHRRMLRREREALVRELEGYWRRNGR